MTDYVQLAARKFANGRTCPSFGSGKGSQYISDFKVKGLFPSLQLYVDVCNNVTPITLLSESRFKLTFEPMG